MKKFSFLLAATAALLVSCSAVCPNCHGTGVQTVQSNGRMKSQSCISCNGTGQISTITPGEALRGAARAASGTLNTIDDHHYRRHGWY